MQLLAPAAENEPVMQLLQTVAPAPLYVLGAHCTQPEDTVPYVPAGHGAHTTLAVALHGVATYVPTAQVLQRLHAAELATVE